MTVATDDTLDLSTPAKTVVPVVTPLLNALPRTESGPIVTSLTLSQGKLPTATSEGEAEAIAIAHLLYQVKLAQEKAAYFAILEELRDRRVMADIPEGLISFPAQPDAIAWLIERGVQLHTWMDHYQGTKSPQVSVTSWVGVYIPQE